MHLWCDLKTSLNLLEVVFNMMLGLSFQQADQKNLSLLPLLFRVILLPILQVILVLLHVVFVAPAPAPAPSFSLALQTTQTTISLANACSRNNETHRCARASEKPPCATVVGGGQKAEFSPSAQGLAHRSHLTELYPSRQALADSPTQFFSSRDF